MNKKLIFFAMISLVSFAAEAKEIVVQNTPFEKKWDLKKEEIQNFKCDLNENCKTLKKFVVKNDLNSLNNVVNRFMVYRSEKGDNWNSLDNTFNSRVGDCEDFVFAKLVLMKELGYDLNKVDVRVMTKNDIGHMTMTYDGTYLDFQKLDAFKKGFFFKFNEKGMRVE